MTSHTVWMTDTSPRPTSDRPAGPLDGVTVTLDIEDDQDLPAAMYAAAGLNADHIAAASLQALGVDASRAARA